MNLKTEEDMRLASVSAGGVAGRIRRNIWRLVSWRPFREPKSNLLAFADRELYTAGLFDPDSDYNGMLGEAVIELVKVFSKQGHSGFSAGICLDVFSRVANFEPLSPLTGEDGEWQKVATGYYQNLRCSRVFKEDGEAYDSRGIIWRDPDGATYTNFKSRVPVVFPYMPISEFRDAPDEGAET